MRKKLFAILMSAMMMVTFMPAMAFAYTDPASATDHEYNNTLTIGTGESVGYVTSDFKTVVKAAAQNDPKHVKILVEPTTTSEGSIELTCELNDKTDGIACGHKITLKLPALSTAHTSCTQFVASTMTLADYYAALVAQGTMSEKEAAEAAKTNANSCYVVTAKCKECGKIKEYSETVAGVTGMGLNPHVMSPADGAKCDATYVCANAICGKTVKKTATQRTVSHKVMMLDGSGKFSIEEGTPLAVKNYNATGMANLWTSVKTDACGALNVYEYTCVDCGATVKKAEAGIRTKGSVAFAAEAINCMTFKGKVSDMEYVTSKWYGEAIKNYSGDTANLKDGYIAVYVHNNDSYGKIEKASFYGASQYYKFYKSDVNVEHENGTVTYGYTCSTCGHVYDSGVEVDPAAACTHVWVAKTEKGNCKTPTLTYKQCNKCGLYSAPNDEDDTSWTKTKVATSTPITDAHAYKLVETVQPTCVVQGYYKFVCDTCKGVVVVYGNDSHFNSVKVGETVYWDTATGEFENHVTSIALAKMAAATTHKYSKKVEIAPATCTHGQLMGYVCDVCGKTCMHGTYGPEVVAGTVLDHKKATFEVAATCETDGYVVEFCENEWKAFDSANETITPGAKSVGDTVTWSKNGTIVGTGKVKTVLPKLGGKCDADKWIVTKQATIFEEGAKALGCSKCGNTHGSTFAVIAKLTYAAPKVSVKKGKVVVTVAAQDGAVKYVVKAGKKTKTVTAAGKVTLKKVAKKGKKVKVTVTAYNAAGAKVVSKAKTVKAK